MNKEPSFFDSRTIIAMAFVVAIIFGWQSYLAKKYPVPQSSPEQIVQDNKTSTISTEKTTAQTENTQKDFVENVEEKVLRFESDKLNLEISSLGMGIKKAELNNYKDRSGEKIVLGNSSTGNYLFELKINSPDINRINFNLEQKSNNEIIGYFKKNNLEIERKYSISADRYTISVETTFRNAPYDAIILMPEKVAPHQGRSFLMPAYENQTVFVNHSNNTVERAIINPEKAVNPLEQELSTVSIASIGSLYFTSVFIDNSQISPYFNTQITTNQNENEAQLAAVTGQVIYRFPTQNAVNVAKNQFYIGPKDIEILSATDERLTDIVNFGWFSWIAKPLLSMMKFFYSIFKNYGVAIILMTLIIRVLMLPLMVSSYRSMKKMQLIQPQLVKLKEKYKDNPQQMQIETMSLYKTHGVNPVAGCLPMFLQLPVFMALYSLLGHSIELYKAPFMLWIHDLSFKDPFYVLPVLMGIAMFVQQKITPSTMDPAQQKILLFMPIIFTFFMLTLPSGLTLYMVVSSLFGIAQQHFFLNDKKSTIKQKEQPIVAQSAPRDV